MLQVTDTAGSGKVAGRMAGLRRLLLRIRINAVLSEPYTRYARSDVHVLSGTALPATASAHGAESQGLAMQGDQ